MAALPALLRAVLPAIAVLLAPVAISSSAGAETPRQQSYRADALRAVPAGVPEQIELLLGEGVRWPAEAREALAAQVRRDWPRDTSYGPIRTGVGLYLDYPLVTARVGRHVVVPVIETPGLRVAGRLDLRSDEAAPRRVVVLVDASSSANARTRFEAPDGSVEEISVLEAEHRAIDHLLDLLGDDRLELGVIAFGEGTWPIVEPGASRETLRRRLAEFRRERPRGIGRTDTVCALTTAVEWLDDTPRGVSREIVLLTDGDTPHSGRFLNCTRGGRDARARCEARRNVSACPAKRGMGGSRSDLVQLERLARRLRKRVRISPVVFEADRQARTYRVLAEDTGGEFVQVPSAQGIEVALPPLVAGRILGVYALNLRTGARSGDLLTPGVSRFEGALPLEPGANDVELRVESDRGTAALLRFRVYRVEDHLARYLAGLRERNRALESRARGLVEQTRELIPAAPKRRLEVAPASIDD